MKLFYIFSILISILFILILINIINLYKFYFTNKYITDEKFLKQWFIKTLIV